MKVDWIRHDSQALLDSKIQELVTKCGMVGYGIYWASMERMYDNDGELSPSSMLLLSRLTGVTSKVLTKVLDALCETGIFTKQGDSYVSEKVKEELSRVKVLNEKRSSGAKKRQDAIRAKAEDKQCLSSGQALTEAEDKQCLSSNTPSRDETRRDETRRDDNSASLRSARSELSETASAQAVLEEIPTTKFGTTGEVYQVTSDELAMLEKAYPAVDVRAELKRVRAWSMANSRDRKTLGGMPRFLNGWMARCQDRGGSPSLRIGNGSLPDSVVHTEEVWAGEKGGKVSFGGGGR